MPVKLKMYLKYAAKCSKKCKKRQKFASVLKYANNAYDF